MALELVVHSYCDNHGEEKVPNAETHSFALDGGAVQEMELCPACYEQVAGPLARLLAEHGRPLRESGKKAKASGTASSHLAGGGTAPSADHMQACGYCDDQKLRAKKTLREHLRKQHGRLFDGTLIADSPHRCPECGDGYADNRGVAVHLRLHHGITRADRDAEGDAAAGDQEMLPA